MLQYERQQQIVEYLKEKHSAKIGELAKKIYVSEASVRRDVAALETAGVVKKIYGGVVLAEYRNEPLPVEMRQSVNSEEKEKIARRAAEIVHDGDIIMLDASSTVRRLCKYLKKRKNLVVITNSLWACSEFEDSDVTVYCTGGEYYKKQECFLGPSAEKYLRYINADKLFFSSKGITSDGTITDVSDLENSMRRLMMKQAKDMYFLCDASKWNAKYAFTLCKADEVTEIICDKPLDQFLNMKKLDPKIDL